MPAWKRTYWAVWAANLVTGCGMMSFLPFFPSHLERLGLEDRASIAAWAGAIYGAAPLAAGVMAPLWGALGDRFGRRWMVVRAMGAITLFVGAMSLATSPSQLLVLRILQGVFSGFLAPSVTLVSVVAPAERQGQITGSLQTALALGAVIGPGIGGLVGPSIGLGALFLGVAACSAVGAALVLAFAHEDPVQSRVVDPDRGVASVLHGTARDLRGIWANARLRATLLLLFVLQFGMGATNPLLELHVGDLAELSHEAAARTTGFLFSAMALVNIAALPLWGRYGDRHGHARGLFWCALTSACALFLHALAPGLALLFAARVLLGASTAGTGPLAFGIAAAEISLDRRGGAFGAVFSARTLALATSSMAGGILSRWLGIRGLFLAGGALVLAWLAWERLRALAEAREARAGG